MLIQKPADNNRRLDRVTPIEVSPIKHDVGHGGDWNHDVGKTFDSLGQVT
jgi:hypothetical protein